MKLLKAEMTSKERLESYYRGKEVDRLPVTITAGETCPLLYGIDICDYYFSADHMVTVESNLALDFHADNMGMGLGLRTLVEALGTRLRYPRRGVSYIEEPVIKDLRQVDNMQLVNIERDGRFPIMLEAFKRLQEMFGKEKVISTGMAGPLTTAIGLYGTEKFLKDSVKRKEEIHKLLRYSTDCVIKCARDLNQKLGISVSLSEPMAARNILSLRQYRTLLKPYLCETVQAFQKFQVAPGIHVCGNTKDRWADIVDSGISSFSLDNCENLEELKKAYGDRVAIVGNIAPVDVLKNGSIEDIKRETRRCILEAADAPKGYTVSPGCTVPIDTPKENLVAFINAVTIYGQGARIGKMPRGITEV